MNLNIPMLNDNKIDIDPKKNQQQKKEFEIN